MKRSNLIGLLFGLFIMVGAIAAEAATAYPCNVHYVPRQGYLGDYGYFHVSYYTGAHCTGSFVTAMYYCSQNPTYNSCPSDSNYIFFDSQSITTVYQSVADAARDGRLVDYSTSTCRSGSAGCSALIKIR